MQSDCKFSYNDMAHLFAIVEKYSGDFYLKTIGSKKMDRSTTALSALNNNHIFNNHLLVLHIKRYGVRFIV